MTAPIRVRGWHTGMKRMISPEELAADQLTLQATGYFINVSSMSTRMSQIFTTTEFVPLLSTGLRDKNGVEIFDGDILATTYRQDGERHREVVVWDDAACGFRMRLSDTLVVQIKIDRDEVIGNIYEHPDLLKKGDEPQAAIAAEG